MLLSAVGLGQALSKSETVGLHSENIKTTAPQKLGHLFLKTYLFIIRELNTV